MVSINKTSSIDGETIIPNDKVIFRHEPKKGYSLRIALGKEDIDEIERMALEVKAVGGNIDSKIEIWNNAIRIASAINPFIPENDVEIPKNVKAFFVKTSVGFEVYAELDERIIKIADSFDDLNPKPRIAVDGDDLLFEMVVKEPDKRPDYMTGFG